MYLVLGLYAVYCKVAVYNGYNVCFVNLILGLYAVYRNVAVNYRNRRLGVYLVLGFNTVYCKVAVYDGYSRFVIILRTVVGSSGILPTARALTAECEDAHRDKQADYKNRKRGDDNKHFFALGICTRFCTTYRGLLILIFKFVFFHNEVSSKILVK